MQTRFRIGLATVSVLVVGCLLCLGNRVSAIALDNDVDISVSVTPPFRGECPDCIVKVQGAPRLATGPDASEFVIHVDIDAPSSVGVFTLNLNVFTADSLQPLALQLLGLNCQSACMTSYDLPVRRFANVGQLTSPASPLAGQALIFTVEAFVRLSGGSGPATVTVTVAGPGHEIVVDTVGDKDSFQQGDALDIPPRSTELARALSRIGTIRGSNRVVELDVDRPRGELAVGFTHSFELDRHDRVQDATLTLNVTGDGPSNDFVLLDNGVRDVGSRERCVPLIPLDTSQGALTIDLSEVTFIWSSYPSLRDHQCFPATAPTDLRSELRDGRLDVIVVGDLRVDFAELRIVLRDPTDH
jgi:hypothetical protein